MTHGAKSSSARLLARAHSILSVLFCQFVPFAIPIFLAWSRVNVVRPNSSRVDSTTTAAVQDSGPSSTRTTRSPCLWASARRSFADNDRLPLMMYTSDEAWAGSPSDSA